MTSAKTTGRKTSPRFTDRIPKALKREAGRTDSRQVPANIRVFGVNLEQNDRVYIRGRLAAKLGKHAASIERVTIRVEDVNGARGGIDQVCRIRVVLSGLPSALVEAHDHVAHGRGASSRSARCPRTFERIGLIVVPLDEFSRAALHRLRAEEVAWLAKGEDSAPVARCLHSGSV